MTKTKSQKLRAKLARNGGNAVAVKGGNSKARAKQFPLVPFPNFPNPMPIVGIPSTGVKGGFVQQRSKARGRLRAGGRLGNVAGMPAQVSVAMINQKVKLRNKDVQPFKIKLFDVTAYEGSQKGTVLNSIIISRDSFNHTRMAPFFSLFERWRIAEGARVTCVPVSATNVPGTFYFQTDPDAADALVVGTTKSDNYITGHKNALEHSIFGAPFSIPITLNKEFLYSDSNRVVVPANSNVDIRKNACGVVNVFVGNGVNTESAVTLGSVWFEGTIEFSEPGYTENSDVVACHKACGVSGGTLGEESKNWLLPNLNYAVMTGSDLGAAAIYQEGNVDANQLLTTYLFAGQKPLLLPVGSYYVEMTIYFAEDPGTMNTTISYSTGMSYTSSISPFSSTPTSAPYYEWVSAPSTITPPVGKGTSIQGIVRVTAPPLGSPFGALSALVECDNAVNPILTSLYCLKIPEAISAPYAEPFPFGSLDGVVSKPRKVLTQKEWSEFQEYQRNNNKVVVVVEEEEKEKPKLPAPAHKSTSVVGSLLGRIR